MKETDHRKHLLEDIALIGTTFYIDPEQKEVGRHCINNWNTTLLALSYVLDAHPLIVGEPGFAKTTAAKVVSAILSGYPFDLYEAAQIQGHPDQTHETMIARPDFSKLSTEERVIWLLSAYLPVRITDEINRLPTGKQDELLNCIQTGRFNYLNATFYTGQAPFFATANHPDDGNHVLIPPLRDRFSIHLESGYIGATYHEQIEAAQDNIQELYKPDITTTIIDLINDPQKSIEEKLKAIDAARKDYVTFIQGSNIQGHVFGADEKKVMQKAIRAVPVSTEARVFSQMIAAELNWTPTHGRKRSNDKIDTSNHAKDMASTYVKNGLSPRAQLALKQYSQGIAYLCGDTEVRKEHVMAMVPYVFGHRLEFTNDFRSGYEGKQRPGFYGLSIEMFLATRLVEGIEKNYGKVKKDLDLVVTAYKESETLKPQQHARVEELKQTVDTIDHPLVREYVMRIKEGR